MVNHFLVVVGHRDPESYCEALYSKAICDSYLAMLIMDWVSLRLCLRSAIFAAFLFVHNSEKLVCF